MRYFAPLAVLWAVTCASRAAWAQERPIPVVTQQRGTELCPDGAALAARVTRVRNGAPSRDIAAYHVDFTRNGGEFAAAIQRGAGATNVRTITARAESCEGLAEATAVTLALLLDAADEPEIPAPQPSPTPAPPAAEASVPERAPAPPLQRERAQTHVTRTFAVAGGLLAGVMRPAAPTLASEVGLFERRLRASFGLLWTVPQAVSYGPGSLRELLLTGTTRLCVAPVARATLRFDLCSGMFAGVSHVHARGYTTNHQRTRAWVAVPAGFALSYLGRPVGIELSALALLPLHHHDFQIDGLGTAYHSWPVSLALSLAALGSWP